MEDDPYHQALRRIDQANRGDPEMMSVDGVPYPRALVYGMRMSDWLQALEPEASIPLRLAARAQHIGRWKMPRTTYPPGRVGYLAWRRAQADYHAAAVGSILEDVGFEETVVRRVQALVRKERLKSDSETQLLEDVACLVFLAYELDDFAVGHPREKVIHILRRTWTKMSPRGRDKALVLAFSPTGASLVGEAIDPDA